MKFLRLLLPTLAAMALLGACAMPRAPVERPALTDAQLAALGPQWRPFRPYLEPMFARIGRQWDRIIVESRFYPPSGSQAVVKFRLNATGQVTSIVSVEGTADHRGLQAAVTAITSAAPFGAWTQEMIAVFGESAELTFTFYYQ